MTEPSQRLAMAMARMRAGDFERALALFDAELVADPRNADLLSLSATTLMQLGRWEEANERLRLALTISPDHLAANDNLGVVLVRDKRYAEAMDRFEHALAKGGSNVGTLLNLANTLCKSGQDELAIARYRELLAMSPGEADGWYNLGIALSRQLQFDAALEAYDRALALRPDYPAARQHRSAVLLAQGDFPQGFAEYEWRLQTQRYRNFQLRWPRLARAEFAGRTVMLCAEQGLGDTLQFVRYAAVVRREAARVIVECPASLHRLLSATAGIDQLTAPDTPPPAADGAVPLLSLPAVFKTTLATVPNQVPYLFADSELVELWKRRLVAYPGWRIGIAWQGNPEYPSDHLRSVPLLEWEPLSRVEGARLINLQVGYGREQLSPLAARFGIVDFPDLDTSAGAFMDTAALMRNLDLIITTDTAVAHLAGGLGVPVWVALPYGADWRWLLDREDSPWYPTMRLFRQQSPGSWSQVFQRMARELATQSCKPAR